MENKISTLQFYFDKACPIGSSLYFAVMGCEEDLRSNLILLSAWWKEVRFITRDCQDAGLARIKLAWWQQQITTPEKSEHPLIKPMLLLQEKIPELFLSLERILQALLLPLNQWGFDDLDHFKNYATESYGNLCVLQAKLIHKKNCSDLTTEKNLGVFFALFDLLENAPAYQRVNLNLFPQTWLGENFSFTRENTPEQLELLRTLVKEARQSSEEYLEKTNNDFGFSFNRVFLKLRLATLTVMEKDNLQVTAKRYALTPWRKYWIARKQIKQLSKFQAERSQLLES